MSLRVDVVEMEQFHDVYRKWSLHRDASLQTVMIADETPAPNSNTINLERERDRGIRLTFLTLG